MQTLRREPVAVALAGGSQVMRMRAQGHPDLPRAPEAVAEAAEDAAVVAETVRLARDQAIRNNFVSTGGLLMSSTENRTSKLCVIAIPVAGGRLCMHFVHCEQFALLDVDTADKEVRNSRRIDPPPHEPGLLPRWLHEQGVNLVIAGGMGQRAQNIFAEQDIRVVVGVPAGSPESVVRAYLDGRLQSSENPCDH